MDALGTLSYEDSKTAAPSSLNGPPARPGAGSPEQESAQSRETTVEPDIASLPQAILEINRILEALPRSRGDAPPGYHD